MEGVSGLPVISVSRLVRDRISRREVVNYLALEYQ